MADDPEQLSMFEYRKRRHRRGDPSDIKVTLELREQPDIDLYVQALVALAEQIVRDDAAVKRKDARPPD